MRHTSTKSPPYSSLNKARLIHSGREYFNLFISLIDHATEIIQLQCYIYENDETGYAIANALIAAVKRNVKVYMLVDGYASQGLHHKFVENLKAAGIQFRFFEPLFRSKYFYFGRRMHHKIFVVDARFALVSGLNIANHYNSFSGSPAWLDFGAFVEGEVAKQLCELCWKTWNNFPLKIDSPPCQEKNISFDFKKSEQSEVRMKRNDWVRRKNEISATYIEMLRHAKSHIIIVSSYFLPGKVIRKLLRHATKRGVKIKVLIAGPSDIRLAKNAERWMYDWLLRNNIQLFEYQPTVLHAKVGICDSEWLTIGSYNINNISAYISIELNLDVRNPNIAKEMEDTLNMIIENDCVEITKERYLKSKTLFNQFVRWSSYQIIRIIISVLTFYYKHEA
ncbi:MAG: phospholipase [Bacteroidetes bacterium]|nr:phospholipase [Bacteroidota bacterium]